LVFHGEGKNKGDAAALLLYLILTCRVKRGTLPIFFPKLGSVSLFYSAGQDHPGIFSSASSSRHGSIMRQHLLLSLLVFLVGCSGNESVNPNSGSIEVNGMQFVWVPAGTFQMGDIFQAGRDDEIPIHAVTLSDGYWLGKYEVTQRQWIRLMDHNPSFFSTCGDDCPVEYVTWHDVQNFILRFNTNSVLVCRLPTEAEWEYAARSGGRDERFPITGKETEKDNFIWHGLNSQGLPHPVGQKMPNALGIFDMGGNVSEWVHDRYDYYLAEDQTNPLGPSLGILGRVVRGGNWAIFPEFTSVTSRDREGEHSKSSVLGFRIACDPGR
jgi:formylglycine-generating enzyme